MFVVLADRFPKAKPWALRFKIFQDSVRVYPLILWQTGTIDGMAEMAWSDLVEFIRNLLLLASCAGSGGACHEEPQDPGAIPVRDLLVYRELWDLPHVFFCMSIQSTTTSHCETWFCPATRLWWGFRVAFWSRLGPVLVFSVMFCGCLCQTCFWFLRCLGHVLKISRSCLDGFLVMFRWRFGDVWVVFRACFCASGVISY